MATQLNGHAYWICEGLTFSQNKYCYVGVYLINVLNIFMYTPKINQAYNKQHATYKLLTKLNTQHDTDTYGTATEIDNITHTHDT